MIRHIYHIYFLSLFVLYSSVISCNTKKNLVVSSKLSKLEKKFNKIDTSSGVRDISLPISKNRKCNIRVFFPKELTKKNMLIIALHWGGGGNVFKEFSTCLVEPGMSSLGAIIISPDGEYLNWNDKYNENKVLKLVDLATRFWNIDPANIVVMGYSNGGIGSWFFADKYPDIFKAAIPMASFYSPKKKINIPLYVIHGEKDELFTKEEVQSIVNLSKMQGTKINFTIRYGLSHYKACDYVEELKKAAVWLKNI